jgi:gliding motility-associated protein GldE
MSGSEAAYSSLLPEDIEKLRSMKARRSEIIVDMYNNPEKLHSTILVANSIFNILAVILAAYLFSGTFRTSESNGGFIAEAVVITCILLLFGEILPRVYAMRRKTSFALMMSYPMLALQRILSPFTFLAITSASYFRRKAGREPGNLSIDELTDALDLASDKLKEEEKILKGIVNFGNTNVGSIMIPRIDVTTIDIKSGFRAVIELIIDSGFSRIPVYSESFDNVKGVLYAKDVLPFMNNPDNFKWQVLIRQPYFVPETKKINDLLKEFQVKKIHMAMVIDEYGGTSGIVTLEDILEEIVGEITDESDEDEILYRKIDDQSYIFDGKVLVDDFCSIVNIDQEVFREIRGESETLAGLILEMTGEIPRKDQVINYKDLRFRIESADKRRIKEIRVDIRKE